MREQKQSDLMYLYFERKRLALIQERRRKHIQYYLIIHMYTLPSLGVVFVF